MLLWGTPPLVICLALLLLAAGFSQDIAVVAMVAL
jgi:hypothetical protein